MGNPGAAGAGGVLRDSKGDLLMAFSVHLGTGSSNYAEVMSLIHGLRRIKMMGVAHIDLESDSMMVVRWLKASRCEVWYLEEFWEELMEMLKEIEFQVSHIYREGNVAADFLARLGAKGLNKQWLSRDIPSNLRGILRMDKLGFPSLRPQLESIFVSASTTKQQLQQQHPKNMGHLPRSLANCTKHEYLHVGHNQINDTYPFWLGTLQQLNILVFHSNGFHDAIRSPETNYTLPNLHIIDLSDNHLSRNLPPGYFTQWDAMKSVGAKNLKYLDDYSIDCSIIITTKGVELEYKKIQDGLTVIDFSCNRFEEDILERLGNLVGLLVLNLSNNAFTGHIPSSFANLTQLESLDLSQNKLFGEIPPDLTHLNFLSKFNVSHNCLIGLIPHGQQFGTFGNTSFEDNRALCGRPLSKIYGDSDNSMPPPSTNFEENQGPKFFFEFGWKAVVMGYGCGFVFGVVIGHIVITRKQDWVIKIFGKKQHQTRIMVNHRK
ncbi:receptor-like protein 34 [Carya illinoinensis]|uniref:receptor-like protein 34 n=1 Tax=Carya illinoinensis TaxID=32201 RepID=UPI001C718EFB|nr:receptor-like protein 34 [Carya illinoinensis]